MTTTHLVFRYAHISMGFIGLLAGAAAMTFSKGSRRHRQSGNVFFVSVLVLAATGAFMAIFIKPNMGNVMGALTAMYLVSTAGATVMRAPGTTGRFEIVAALAGLAISATGITFGLQALNSPNGRLHGYSPVLFFVFAGVTLIAALLDMRMIARGGFTGTARTTRHLARMCLALYMVTGSFFLGQARLFPAEVRETGLLPIPAFLPIGLLLYWLIRVRVWPSIRTIRSAANHRAVSGSYPRDLH